MHLYKTPLLRRMRRKNDLWWNDDDDNDAGADRVLNYFCGAFFVSLNEARIFLEIGAARRSQTERTAFCFVFLFMPPFRWSSCVQPPCVTMHVRNNQHMAVIGTTRWISIYIYIYSKYITCFVDDRSSRDDGYSARLFYVCAPRATT